jgi:hypothetical protein
LKAFGAVLSAIAPAAFVPVVNPPYAADVSLPDGMNPYPALLTVEELNPPSVDVPPSW